MQTFWQDLRYGARVLWKKPGFTLIALITGFILMIGPTSALGQTVVGADVPMQFHGTMPAIEVLVNGQGPFLFAIDTGGSGLARIDASLVRRLGLRVIGKSKGGALSGRSVIADKVKVGSITIGNIQFPVGEATSRDYNGDSNKLKIDGILCYGLFSKHLLTLDYPAKRVRLEAGDLSTPDGSDILPLRRIYKGVPFTWGLPFIETRVGDFSYKAFIDSGFNADSFLFPKPLVEKLHFDSPPSSAGKGAFVGDKFDLQQGRLKENIRIGKHVFSKPLIYYPNIGNYILIPSGVLREFAITFDQKNHRVRFIKH